MFRWGIHDVYDPSEDGRDERFRQLDVARPALLVVLSHTPRADYERLYAEHPDALWVIRAKTGPQNRGSWLWRDDGSQADSILDYAEWGEGSEHTLRDALSFLTERGITPYVHLGCEPRLELATNGDDPESVRAACEWLVTWWLEQYDLVKAAFPGAQVAPPPLDQGWPEMFDLQTHILAPIFAVGDWIPEHAYTDGRAYSDPDWADRWRQYWRPLFPDKPLIITEFNDNGKLETHPSERRRHLAGYVTWLRSFVDPMLLGAGGFTIAGSQRDQEKPSWWFWNDALIEACRDAAETPFTQPKPKPDPETEVSTVWTHASAVIEAEQRAWQSVDPSIEWNEDSAFLKAWRLARHIGPPVTPELPIKDEQGNVVEVFQGHVNETMRYAPGMAMAEVYRP